MLAAAFLPVLAAGPASAAPPIIAADPARLSDVAVTDGSTYFFYHRDGGYIDVACVAFVNHGPRTATKVGLNFAYVDASGTILGVDVIYPTGKFFVDKRSAFSGVRGASLVENGNCHPTFAGQHALHSTFQYRMGRGAPPTDVAAILVSAREIVYDDGTAWRTDRVPQPGDRVALPRVPVFTAAVADGPPVVTARAVTGSPVELNDALALPPSSRGGQGACVTFTNRDSRVAKRVNVALALVDRMGTVVDVKTLFNTGTFSPGIRIDNSAGACTSIDGTADGDSLVYHPPGRDATAIGRIIATPLLVEFTDGTSWQAPNPPKAGDGIAAP